MRLTEYKRLQEATANRVGALALAIVSPMMGERITESDVATTVAALFPTVEDGRRQEAQVATEFYQSQREKSLGERRLELVAPPETYRQSNLVDGLTQIGMVPGREFTTDVEAVSTVTRHVRAGSRRNLVGLSLVDDEAQGWARTSGGTSACSFCLMLIGRGPVYRSRRAAQGMKAFHNRCDCVVVPVFNRDRFPGRAEYLRAEQMWKDSTKNKSGPEALKSFRSAITGNAPGGRDAARTRAA